MNFPVISVIVFGVELPLGNLVATALLERHRAVWAITRGDEAGAQDLFNTWLTGLHCDGRLEVSQWEAFEPNPTNKTIASWDSSWSVDGLGRRIGFDALVIVRPRRLGSVEICVEENSVYCWTQSRLDKTAIIVSTRESGDDEEEALKDLNWVLCQLRLGP